jgi:hypothetical protein
MCNVLIAGNIIDNNDFVLKVNNISYLYLYNSNYVYGTKITNNLDTILNMIHIIIIYDVNFIQFILPKLDELTNLKRVYIDNTIKDKILPNNHSKLKIIENTLIITNDIYILKSIIKNTNFIEDKIYLDKMDDFCKIMNLNKTQVLKNCKQEFRYFCYKYIENIRKIELPIITINNYYEAVLIEFRCLPHLEFLIRNSINKLGNKWSQTIICGNDNYDYMTRIVSMIERDIKIVKLDYNNIDVNIYNKLLMTTDFWNNIVGEKILIYQEDTCIFKSNIDEFLEWDYIGAPFLKSCNDTPNCVGNGGLSLRTKRIMIEVINKIHYIDTIFNSSTINYMKSVKLIIPPEDVYFSKNMQDFGIGKVADWDTAYSFSSESIVNKDSFGGHGIWCRDVRQMKEIMYKNVVTNIN